MTSDLIRFLEALRGIEMGIKDAYFMSSNTNPILLHQFLELVLAID